MVLEQKRISSAEFHTTTTHQNVCNFNNKCVSATGHVTCLMQKEKQQANKNGTEENIPNQYNLIAFHLYYTIHIGQLKHSNIYGVAMMHQTINCARTKLLSVWLLEQ